MGAAIAPRAAQLQHATQQRPGQWRRFQKSKRRNHGSVQHRVDVAARHAQAVLGRAAHDRVADEPALPTAARVSASRPNPLSSIGKRREATNNPMIGRTNPTRDQRRPHSRDHRVRPRVDLNRLADDPRIRGVTSRPQGVAEDDDANRRLAPLCRARTGRHIRSVYRTSLSRLSIMEVSFVRAPRASRADGITQGHEGHQGHKADYWRSSLS